MNVDTDTFSAISAEAEMLRRHAARGRHRAPRKPEPGQRRSDKGRARWWWRAGYAAAMGEVITVMGEAGMSDEALPTADPDARLTVAEAGRARTAALMGVLAFAEGVRELYYADGVPPGWADR